MEINERNADVINIFSDQIIFIFHFKLANLIFLKFLNDFIACSKLKFAKKLL